jgi:hypothetical protein
MLFFATAPAGNAADIERSVPALHPGERHVLLLMIDGLAVDSFEAALAAHELPHLERLFAARPTLRTQALSTFPSATAPSVPELLSGRWVDLETLPVPNAVHAFDREDRRVVRYLVEPDSWSWPLPNLLDAAAEAGLPAVTVFEGRWKTARSILTTAAIERSALLEIVGASELTSGDRRPVEAFLARTQKLGAPPVALVVFNEVDLKGHFHGPASRDVRRALVATDALIGEIVETLRQEKTPGGRSVLDDTTIVLFGDHGMVPSGRFLDLTTFFRSRGLVAYDAASVRQVVLRERLGSIWTRWPDALLVSGGSNITQVYLRKPSGGWIDGAPPFPEEAERALRRPDLATLARQLAGQPGVSQVVRLVAPRTVEIRASGERLAWVVERGEGKSRRWAYVVPDTAMGDPLGYLDDSEVAPLVARSGSLTDASFFDIETWIERTRNARYPAAVPLVQKAFHPLRFAGDLMVTAQPGWTFIKGQHGDHGSFEREAMLTPLVLNGPGIDEGATLPFSRLVDIYPTAAVLLGAGPNDPALTDLDGRVLPGVRPPA